MMPQQRPMTNIPKISPIKMTMMTMTYSSYRSYMHCICKVFHWLFNDGDIAQVKREAEHFKSSVESGKRKRSRGSKDSAAAAEEVSTVQKPFVFQQKETEAQIRKRKMVVEEVNTSTTGGVEPEVKKKKLKKKKENENSATTEKSKSKKGKRLQQESQKSSKGRSKEGGERSALLKSVFSGGGCS